MDKVLRKEKKYLLNPAEKFKIIGALDKLLKKDDNSLPNYKVRSLYFDTLFDQDYNDKRDGIECRKKIRLRCYPPNMEFAMLEMKQKQGENQLKRSMKISREHAVQIIKGDLSCLLTYDEEFAKECYAIMKIKCYKPVTMLEYIREVYVFNGNQTRVTFDSHICFTDSCFDIFSNSLCLSPSMDCYGTIMEIKYNGFLAQYIKDVISIVDKSESSVSKYCITREKGCKFPII